MSSLRGHANAEEDAQRTREQLTSTVDTLRGRISDAISPTVVGRDLQTFLIRKARENPLQAAGVAAGLAFPISRMLANIPAPILFVGAGLALSKTSFSETAADAVGEGIETARSATVEAVDSVKGMAAHVAQAAGDAMESVSGSANALRSGASDATASASGGISSATQQVTETFEQYPLLLGAIGLAVGAVLGGSIPVTRSEREAFGELSDDLRRQATTLASTGMEAAREAAAGIYEEATDEADRQGLNLENAHQVATDLGEKAAAIAEKTAGELPAGSTRKRT